jgi:outer membrane protein assembly factor BamB
LAGVAAGLFCNPAAMAAGALALPLRQKVATGNATLSPLAADADTIYFCGDRRAGAVNIADGGVLWNAELAAGEAYQFRPRVAGQSVVFSGQRGLAVHNARDGAAVWRRAAELQAGVPMLSESRIVFGDGHQIVSVDLTSGKEVWRFAGVPDTLANYAPAQAGATVFAAPGDGRLYALDAGSGRLLWQHDGREEWQYLRQLRIHGDILVAGSYKEKLFGIAVADGRRLWEFNAGNFINSQVVEGGVAYLWSPTGFIYAVEATTGAVLWRHETTDYGDKAGNWGPLMAELVVADGKLLALDMFDVLHVLRTSDGEAEGHHRVPARIRHAVLPLANGDLAFPSQQGEVIVTGGV